MYMSRSKKSKTKDQGVATLQSRGCIKIRLKVVSIWNIKVNTTQRFRHL